MRDARAPDVSAWDTLFPREDGAALKLAAHKSGVRIAESAADALAGADIVISAVTASSSLDVAADARAHLTSQQYFLDINTVSPGRKRTVATALAGVCRYVDLAVMAPVHPARHRTPMLAAGPDAEDIATLLSSLDMRVGFAGSEIGQAAAIKMIRSVMVKGLEALSFECFVSAHRAGVASQVLESLQASFPGFAWDKQTLYNLERMTRHGVRRAAEMREVAATLAELNIDPAMTRGSVIHQQRLGDLAFRLPGDGAELHAALDQVSEAMSDR